MLLQYSMLIAKVLDDIQNYNIGGLGYEISTINTKINDIYNGLNGKAKALYD